MKSYKAELKYFEEQKNRPTLESLIEGKPYDKAIAELKEIAEDKGYTAAWLKQQTAQLNKDYHTYLQRAVEDYNAQLEKVKDKYQTANGVYFEHNYTAADYADLQFLQTLIKTRILNESGNNPVLVERILKDYINTVKGARAVMFLANDSEIGKCIKPHYDMAVNNAQTVAEKRFVAEKEATLDKIADEINRMEVNRTIGAALLKQSNERVTADFVDRANAIYWGSEDKGESKDV